MPGFDRTGPEGKGEQTGRGIGPCGDGKEKTRSGRPRRLRRLRRRGKGRGIRAFLSEDLLGKIAGQENNSKEE